MLQSRLHFRIHSAQTDIRAKLKEAKGASKDELDPPLPLLQQSSFDIPMTEDEAKKVLQAR